MAISTRSERLLDAWRGADAWYDRAERPNKSPTHTTRKAGFAGTPVFNFGYTLDED